MSKPKPPASTSANPLNITAAPNEERTKTIARTALRPSVRAAVSTQAVSKQFGELDLSALVDELAAQNSAVSRGNMARPEAMLMSQAHTLEILFHELTRRATLNMGEYLNAAETYMRLALKAQSQCRATLETLAAIKNPAPVTFVRQANVANGPQQVNNAASPAEASRARETENSPSKLLEQQHGERLDPRAPPTSNSADSSLETVGAIHRADDGSRKGAGAEKCIQGPDTHCAQAAGSGTSRGSRG